MKITLDLSKLVEDGKLTATEADKLKALASHETGSLAINALIGFGVSAVAVGSVALVGNFWMAIALGLGLFAVGCGFVLNRIEQWQILGQICLVIGALMFSGGVIGIGDGSLSAMLIITIALVVGSLTARSSLLAALAVLAMSACLGARTGYSHATYSLAIFEPTLTVVMFTVLAFVAYQASKRVAADYERIATTAARTSILLVNFGFWIGSLWGDPLMLLRGLNTKDPSAFLNKTVISAGAFSIAWALVLLAAAVWGAFANRRWLVNVASAFGAIHFYTQWFERLGATPVSILLGGLVLLAIALALWAFNKRAMPAAA